MRLITITHDYCGLSERDVELARQISATARELGASADPLAVQTVQVSIDALVIPEVLPFWRAVLGYRERGDSPEEDLIDPRGRGPSFWFHHLVSDEHAPAWWTLADAEGNEVAVATPMSRG